MQASRGLPYLVLVQEDVQLLHADAQIRLVELVWNVPTQWPELPPFLHQRVEEAQAVQQCLELSLTNKWKHITNNYVLYRISLLNSVQTMSPCSFSVNFSGL